MLKCVCLRTEQSTPEITQIRLPRAETVMRAYEIAGCTQVKSSLQLVQPCVLVAIDSLLHLRWSQNACVHSHL